MTIVFCLFLFMLVKETKIKKFNYEYIHKDTTTQINGIFVFLVFLSHFMQYLETEMPLSIIYNGVRGFLGQLVVSTFLFYSGYGVYTSILNKRDKYIDGLPAKIIKLFISFSLVILLYLLIALITGKDYSVSRILLSFIGWTSIGNSNWYFFDIVLLYIITFVSFKIAKDDRYSLIMVFILSVTSMFVLSIYKEAWWYDTFLCFWLGMIYSKYKTNYESLVLKSDKVYRKIGIILLILFLICLLLRDHNILFYILHALLFVLMIVHISMMIKFDSTILTWLGSHIFEIYTLQRVGMILFKYIGLNEYAFLYFLLSLVCTIILSIIFKTVNKKVMTVRSPL